jgi:hypothetical protein
VQWYYVSSCLLVGRRGKGGRTGWYKWGSRVVNDSLFGNKLKRDICARDFRVRQSSVLVVAVMVVVRGGKAKHQYARRLYPHDVLRSPPQSSGRSDAVGSVAQGDRAIREPLVEERRSAIRRDTEGCRLS